MTNDGELTNRLLHPSHQVEKTYLAEVDGIPSYQSLQKLRKGVLLSDGMTAPAKVEIVRKKGKNARVEVTIHEGRNRQVRRMLEHIGHPVLHLKRTKLAFLTLEGVSLGSWRELTTAEVRALYEL